MMQQLNACQDYGSIVQIDGQYVNYSSAQQNDDNDEPCGTTPLTPLERVQLASTAGSEYYMSLSSMSRCNSAKNMVCFRVDESHASSLSSSSSKFVNIHSETSSGDDKNWTHHHSNDTKEQKKHEGSGVKATIRKSCDSFLRYLGFVKNPVFPSSSSLASTANISSFSQEDSIEHDSSPLLVSFHHNANKPKAQVLTRRNSSYADVRLSMVSNFSAAYNTINISLALALMKSLYPPSTPSDISICSSALIAGMIIGQLMGGMLGDWLGRHAAMAVVMSLQVVAAFSSGWVGWIGIAGGKNFDWNIYSILAVWRFLLGVGCGGVYPLAASIAAESSSGKEDRGQLVALTFSMQGVGYLTVSLVAYTLVWFLGEDSDSAWRMLLGFGCIPGILLICIRLMRRKANLACDPGQTSFGDNALVMGTEDMNREDQNTGGRPAHLKSVRLPPASLFQQIQNEPDLFRKIVGTAGCWLLFDILFYGNTLFQPVVLSAAFGRGETVLATVRDSTWISLMALPGYFVSVFMVGKKQSPKSIQLQGFLLMSVLYTLIGVYFTPLARHRVTLLTLYGLTFFFSNYGPNSTTFMMPSMTFSRPCRSTLNGLCAASGKLGALLGATLFVPLANWLGNDCVMMVCAGVSVVAAAMTMTLSDEAESVVELEDEEKVSRISSEAHLAALMQECLNEDIEEKKRQGQYFLSNGHELSRVSSMPTFLDFQ